MNEVDTIYLIKLGNSTGLTILDVLLLSLCPIATMLGTMVSNAVSKIVNKPEYTSAKKLPPHHSSQLGERYDNSWELDKYNAAMMQRYYDKIRRENLADSIRLPFVGLVLGLVIALYFVGAITSNVTSLARILGLCVLLGYQAPSLWITQGKAIKKLVDKKVESLIGIKDVHK